MHWRQRIGAIVVAGGSLAACGGDGDGGGLVREAATTGALPSRAPAAPSVARAASASDGLQTGYAIPMCNANPDPCCRLPDLPECQRDAGPEDAGAEGACDAHE
jgi:hypothetical protein